MYNLLGLKWFRQQIGNARDVTELRIKSTLCTARNVLRLITSLK